MLRVNATPAVAAKRTLRGQLRGLDLSNTTVHHEYDQWVNKTVKDGIDYEDIKDAEGNITGQREKDHMSTIKVHMFYHNGHIRVGATGMGGDWKNAWGYGFDPSLNYA